MSKDESGLGLKVHEDAYRELEEELAKAKAKLEEVGFRACCVLLERDEARQQRDELRKHLKDANKGAERNMHALNSAIANRLKAERELSAVTAERDKLAEALQEIADCDFVITLPDRMDAVRAIAREALGDINWYKS